MALHYKGFILSSAETSKVLVPDQRKWMEGGDGVYKEEIKIHLLISSLSMMVIVARSGEIVTQSAGRGLIRVMEKDSMSSSSRASSRIPSGMV